MAGLHFDECVLPTHKGRPQLHYGMAVSYQCDKTMIVLYTRRLGPSTLMTTQDYAVFDKFWLAATLETFCKTKGALIGIKKACEINPSKC